MLLQKGKLQKRKQLELKTGSPEGARDSWGETMPALPPAFKSSPFLQDFVQVRCPSPNSREGSVVKVLRFVVEV